jgi:hypothetical protein
MFSLPLRESKKLHARLQSINPYSLAAYQQECWRAQLLEGFLIGNSLGYSLPFVQ